MMTSHTVVFLDTNIFLHYRAFDEIDWKQVTGSESVLIVISPITVRELNKHKDSHSVPHIRKRAANIIQRISKLFNKTETESVTIRNGIDGFFETRDPDIQFNAYNLRSDIQDDQLIASIIAFRDERTQNDIWLITSDLGLLLVGKARRLNIQARQLSDDYKLPPEQDSDKKRIQELEQEIRAYQTRIPKPSLSFLGGKQYANFEIHPPTALSDSEIQRSVDEIKQKFPKMLLPSESGENRQAKNIADMLSEFVVAGMDRIAPEAIEEYNRALERYYERYAKYLVTDMEAKNTNRLILKLDIQLVNSGTAPAEDVDIHLHFPDGFSLLSGSKLPRRPEIPMPPSKPKTRQQQINEQFQIMRPSFDHLTPVLSRDFESPPNVSWPTIRRTNSYDVDIHVENVKHNLPEELHSLYVLFESYETVSSFQIDYTIYVANVPAPVTGQLHVSAKRSHD